MYEFMKELEEVERVKIGRKKINFKKIKTVEEYMQKMFEPYTEEEKNDREGDLRIFHIINFKDGSSMSIQASSFHYSTPKLTFDDVTKYSEFEVLMHVVDKKNRIDEFRDKRKGDPFRATSQEIEKQFLLLKKKVGYVNF